MPLTPQQDVSGLFYLVCNYQKAHVPKDGNRPTVVPFSCPFQRRHTPQTPIPPRLEV